MKKFIIVLSIVALLGMGIVLGTMTAQNVYQSNHDYIGYDLTKETDDIETENNQAANNQAENNQAANSQTAEKVSSESSIESKDTLSESIDLALDKTETIESETIESETNESETNETVTNEIETNDSDSNSNEANNDTTEIKITNNNTSEDEEAQEAVEAALNITNPSIKIDASSAILLDSKTGKVLYHKNATAKVYPASTTKLITALVALDYCELDEEITIGKEITYIASDSSRAYLKQGEKLTLQMLLEGMLIPSGNDAAYAVAAYVGRISLADKADTRASIQEFVRLMNNKTEDLGLKSTHFMSPDGYDADGQYTTAYDMGIIAIEALKNSTIREITSKSSANNKLLSGENVTWNQSNKLIVSGSGQYYKYAIGLKTGSSSLAGKCLVSAAEKDNDTYISVIMNSTSSGRWKDSIALLKYGIER